MSRKLLISAKLKHHLFIATQFGFPDTQVQYNTAIKEYKEVSEEFNLPNDYSLVFTLNHNIQFTERHCLIVIAPPDKGQMQCVSNIILQSII